VPCGEAGVAAVAGVDEETPGAEEIEQAGAHLGLQW
jgi:hypothetical protein